MPGDDVIHPVHDRWARLVNFDFCSEVEPTVTWPYMTWINPATQQLKARNKDDTDWLIIGGAGGGGAPADAQYLVLAVNPNLSAERRLIPGDGLQATDGGAEGDYTLNIDAGDFAGTGLEDDGSENLRIAAAAAGDGLQGGGGSALAVDTTVVRTSGAQTIAGIKTFNDDVKIAAGKDIFPVADTCGLAKRSIHFGGGKVENFRGSFEFLTSGWAGAPFDGTPSTIDFSSYDDFVSIGDGTTNDRFFRYRTTDHSLGTAASLRSRLQLAADGKAGIRLDTGDDNDFVELYIESGSTGLMDIVSRYQENGGGITTTVEVNDIPIQMVRFRISTMSNNNIRIYFGIDTWIEGLLATIAGDMDNWSEPATRLGIIYQRTAGTDTATRRGYFDWVDNSFSLP